MINHNMHGYRTSYYLKHPHKYIHECYLTVKYFIQRGYRGYADCDIWDLGSYLNKVLPSAIRECVKGKYGTPVGFATEVFPVKLMKTSFTDLTAEEWDEIHKAWVDCAEQMAVGFEASQEINEEMPAPTSERYRELEAKRNRGLNLFSKFYEYLWN